MVSLNQIAGNSRPRFAGEIRRPFCRNGLENALILAVNERGEILEWAADINAVILPAFVAFAPEGTNSVQVWAWRGGLEFKEVKQYSFNRLAARIPGVLEPAILRPLTPPLPNDFIPRLPGINNPNGSRREPAYRS